MGPARLEAGVPTMLRLATAPWAGPLLHGRSVATRSGRLHFAWLAHSQTLALHCAPCSLRVPSLGGEPLLLEELRLSVRRTGNVLEGDIASGPLRATWQGRLDHSGMRLRMDLPMSPIADGYVLFAAGVPELARARIEGRFALMVQLSLPDGSLTVAPQIEGFQVSGLGTAGLAGARSSCSPSRRASRLATDGWLAQAVIAAEDQRFYEHPGFDLRELSASLSRNQREGRIERGASTLSQQLAKLLVTGDERSPARKLRELLYAVEMEQALGKQRILMLYLQHAPWGDGLCGAEAAAQHYFGVRAHELTPGQAAWLAAMLHNPAMEAGQWLESGQINLVRTRHIVLQLRGMPRQQRERLATTLDQLPWTRRP